MSANHGAVIDLIAQKVDPATLELVRDALGDSERLSVIRDLFLLGDDAGAVAEIQSLAPRQIYKFLGISSNIAIWPAQAAQITVRPQLPYSPTRLFVGRSCARHFIINEMRVGNRSQLVAYGDIPADLFAGDLDTVENPIKGELRDGFWTVSIERKAVPLIGLPISFPEVRPGEDISITVTNVDLSIDGEGGHNFNGAFLGFTRGH